MSTDQRPTALVTGASGFIGRRLVALLAARGLRVITTTRGASGPEDGGRRTEDGWNAADGETVLRAVGKGQAVGADAAKGTSAVRPPSSVLCPPPSVHLDLASDARIELPAGIDTIFHLAGKAHALGESVHDESEYQRINTEGTRRLLEAAQRAGVRAFVYVSSVKAAEGGGRNWGKGQEGRGKGAGGSTRAGENAREGVFEPPTESPISHHMSQPPFSPSPLPLAALPRRAIDETCDLWPQDAYGRSKRAAEELVLRGAYVPHAVVLRPCLVYGPQPKGNLEKMITAVRRGRFPPVPEFGNRRSMVHVDDVCAAALLAAENPAANSQTYILCDDEPFSTRQLFEWISAAAGKPVPRWTIPRWTLRALARTGDVIGRVRGRRFTFDSDALKKLSGDAWYSADRIKRELGWSPRHSLREAMAEVCGEGAAEPR